MRSSPLSLLVPNTTFVTKASNREGYVVKLDNSAAKDLFLATLYLVVKPKFNTEERFKSTLLDGLKLLELSDGTVCNALGIGRTVLLQWKDGRKAPDAEWRKTIYEWFRLKAEDLPEGVFCVLEGEKVWLSPHVVVVPTGSRPKPVHKSRAKKTWTASEVEEYVCHAPKMTKTRIG